jgi:hypothetical protein
VGRPWTIHGLDAVGTSSGNRTGHVWGRKLDLTVTYAWNWIEHGFGQIAVADWNLLDVSQPLTNSAVCQSDTNLDTARPPNELLPGVRRQFPRRFLAVAPTIARTFAGVALRCFSATARTILGGCLTQAGPIRRTLPGQSAGRQPECFVSCDADFVGNCQVICEPLRPPLCEHFPVLREMFPHNCLDTEQLLRGECPDDSSDIARTIRRTLHVLLRGHCANCCLTFM